MKGRNKIRKIVKTDIEGKLEVHSIWHTIQGEGPWTGYPAYFIRLFGCNLRCWFCDTDFESVRRELYPSDILECMKNMAKPNTTRVVITGGEPLRQNLTKLIDVLNSAGYGVQVETSGSILEDSAAIRYNYSRLFRASSMNLMVCSPKTPTLNKPFLRFCKHFKYVIKANEVSPDDGLPITSTQQRHKSVTPAKIARPPEGSYIWVMPMDEADSELNKQNQRAAVLISMNYGYRLSLQTHKILGLD